MRVTVHQPNYVPWSGYFAKMFVSDVFIFLDDVQLPGGSSYVSRAKIANGKNGEQWLTVPILKSGLHARKSSHTINKVGMADPGFATKHLSTLRHTYSRTPFRDEIIELLAPVYERAGDSLATFNMDLIRTVAGYLGWEGKFVLSSDRPSDLTADERLAELVSQIGGNTYISGAGGEKYQSDTTYRARSVELEVRTYRPIEYARSGWDWVPGLSCVDALFHQGPAARDTMSYEGGDA
jgi:hypothetical protein